MKCLSIWMATAIAVFTEYGHAAEPSVIPVRGDAATSLYGGGAASRDDGIKKQAGDSFGWKGSGQITWKCKWTRRETTRSSSTTPRTPALLDSACRSAAVKAGLSARWRRPRGYSETSR